MNWLDSIGQAVIQTNKVVGLHVQITGNAEVQLSYVELRKEKGLVIRSVSEEGISLDEACSKVNADLPVCLSIDGKGVLCKKLQHISGKEPLDEVLPHANKEEFYYSILEEEGYLFVALARKDLVNKVLEELISRKLKIASVQLGFSAISAIIPFIRGGEIFLPQMKLVIDGNQLLDFSNSRESKTNMIGDEEISPALCLPYAHGVQMLLGTVDNIQSNLHFREEWLQRELHKKLLIGVLGFFFLLLLSNFFIFSNLSSDNAALSAAINENQYQLNRLGQLEQKVKSQQNLYQTLGLGRQSFFSFYADRLASSINNRNIRLNRLEVHPLLKSKDRTLSFGKGKIVVEGSCDNPLLINRWLGSIEREEWVKEIRDRQYKTNLQNGEGFFSFEIYIREEW